ncbi:MAG TPA: hypothetical protein PLO90_02020 [Clostridia bacterium]|nr:hypothetical protein [Clostridia bacterium]HQA97573.1 hypothetical protein [Clostridia bacterium]HQO55563.1 hypothetical protein [Clostridia bacterium]
MTRQTERLFSNQGKLMVLAMDHAQGGLMEGLEKPLDLARRHADSPLDGFLMNVGPAAVMQEPALLGKKLLLRAGFGGSMQASEFTNVHRNHVSPQTALRLGADAVVMMVTIGGADYQSLQDAAGAIDAYHQLGIPVVAEILASDFSQTMTYEIQANGARIAAELGADVVKALYTENFDKVVAYCPVPILLAGGPKDHDILVVAHRAVDVGVRGFAFGRNLFQNPQAGQLIQMLDSILRG